MVFVLLFFFISYVYLMKVIWQLKKGGKERRKKGREKEGGREGERRAGDGTEKEGTGEGGGREGEGRKEGGGEGNGGKADKPRQTTLCLPHKN